VKPPFVTSRHTEVASKLKLPTPYKICRIKEMSIQERTTETPKPNPVRSQALLERGLLSDCEV
jgi:hypothetical protein